MSMDFGDLLAFEVELGDLPRQTITNVRKGIEVAARATKDEFRSVAKGASGAHARRYPGTINYDMDLKSDGEITAEVGPVPGGQGSLGILDDGGAVNAAPQHASRAAAKVAEKELIVGVLKALDEVL
jgi:hypothetical protein